MQESIYNCLFNHLDVKYVVREREKEIEKERGMSPLKLFAC
jgi:hypothetical protein